VRVGAVVKYSK